MPNMFRYYGATLIFGFFSLNNKHEHLTYKQYSPLVKNTSLNIHKRGDYITIIIKRIIEITTLHLYHATKIE